MPGREEQAMRCKSAERFDQGHKGATPRWDTPILREHAA